MPTDLLARTRHVHDTLKAARAPRPRVAVIDGTDPLSIAGHAMPDLVKRAGGIDVVGVAGGHSQSITVDALRDADPDVIIFALGVTPLDAASDCVRACLARPVWRWARDRRVLALDGSTWMARDGSSLVTGIDLLAALFNPSCFPSIDTSSAAVVLPD